MAPANLLRIALVALVAVCYLQTAGHELLALDDPAYVRDNEVVKRGLTTEGVVWAFTTTTDTNWFPMTWLSLMLDTQLHKWFGFAMPLLFEKDENDLFPGGYHLTNVLLHGLNALILFGVLRTMTANLWASALAAALLAVHPIHIESVAWVTERKDVLSMFFMLLTLRTYIYYVRDRDLSGYIQMAMWFALGLMSKSMLVTLPCVLLLLDFWPLKRLPEGLRARTFWRQFAWLTVEKVPLVCMSVAAAAITASLQVFSHSSADGTTIPLSVRLENVAMSYVRYIGKLIWPVDLSILYPNPALIGQPFWNATQVAFAVTLLIAITAAVLIFGWKRRYLLVGWLWYLGTMVPVIGFIQIGRHSMADRYAYIPFIGLYIMLAWGVTEFASHRRKIMPLVATLVGIALVCLTARTVQQTTHWRNSISIFTHALRVSTDNWVIHTGLGLVYFVEAGRLAKVEGQLQESDTFHERGIAELEIAARINPHSDWIVEHLANAYDRAGRHIEAQAQWERAIALKPDYARWRWSLALVLAKRGLHLEALGRAREAVDLDPNSAHAHFYLAMVMSEQDKLDDAIASMEKAFAMDPDLEQEHGPILERIIEAREAARRTQP